MPRMRVLVMKDKRLVARDIQNMVRSLYDEALGVVAEIAEAMSSHKLSWPSHGIDKAVAGIAQNKGALHDATVVDHCVRLFKEKGFSFE